MGRGTGQFAEGNITAKNREMVFDITSIRNMQIRANSETSFVPGPLQGTANI